MRRIYKRFNIGFERAIELFKKSVAVKDKISIDEMKG
jgi:hypothetical protein